MALQPAPSTRAGCNGLPSCFGSSHTRCNSHHEPPTARLVPLPQVTALFEELQNFLGPLLLKRRSGVIAALVAACGRAGVCQREVCAALAKALASLPQWQGREGEGCERCVSWLRPMCVVSCAFTQCSTQCTSH